MSSPYNYPPQGYPPPKPRSTSTSTIVLIIVLVMLVPMCICGSVASVGLLLPAVQAARDAARIQASSNRLKQIGIALHTYHDLHKTLPPAFIPDEMGQPKTSWRTLLLPVLEQGALHSQYDENVPWNDPRNAAVVSTPLPVWQSPRDESRMSNRTSYVVVRGSGTAFEGSTGHAFADLSRGLANTVLVVEIRNSDIAWAEPRDLDLDTITTDPNAPNSINLGAGVVVLVADGTMHTLRGLSLEEFKALLLREGTATLQ